MVVDDDQDLAEMLSIVLNGAGMEVDLVGRGDQVLDIFSHLRKIPQDVIFQKQALCTKVYAEIKELTTFQNQYNTLFEIY